MEPLQDATPRIQATKGVRRNHRQVEPASEDETPDVKRNHFIHLVDTNFLSFKQAMESDESASPKKTCDDEISSFIENKTWPLVPLPTGQKATGSKRVFKIKQNPAKLISRILTP